MQTGINSTDPTSCGVCEAAVSTLAKQTGYDSQQATTELCEGKFGLNTSHHAGNAVDVVYPAEATAPAKQVELAEQMAKAGFKCLDLVKTLIHGSQPRDDAPVTRRQSAPGTAH